MKTKLVYVLSCAPEHNYIEQALLSIYTARYHNPNAHIVLIVDNLTNNLFIGKRAEILNYITEKLVYPLGEDMTMETRSRYLKTSFRNLINEDLLYIDCDTLITGSLEQIDEFSIEIGAVLDSHLPVARLNSSMYEKVEKLSALLDWDVAKEKFYFSSGVVYAKDSENTKLFFKKWHAYWLEGTKKGVSIDQPSFAKANIELRYPIQRINDRWNCVMYTHPLFDKEAKILHFCSFRNMSYVFGDKFLKKVKDEGVKGNKFITYSILHPYNTYLPFDNAIFNYRISDYLTMIKNVGCSAKLLTQYLDACYDEYIPSNGFYKYVRFCFKNHLFYIGAVALTLYKFYKIKLNKNYHYVSNTCSIDLL